MESNKIGKKFWLIVAAIILLAVFLNRHDKWVSIKRQMKEQWDDGLRQRQCRPIIGEKKYIPISDKPVELKPDPGMTLCFEPMTKGVNWWVMPDGDQSRKRRRPPIDSPEYTAEKFGEFKRVHIWVDPGYNAVLTYWQKPKK